MSFETLKNIITAELAYKLLGTCLTFLFIFIVYRLVRKHLRAFAENILKINNVISIEKAIKFLFTSACFLYILSLFGVNLSALLGAAGILTVAIGFAAQTSFSNIISGFFVIGDKAFVEGDFITIDDISGTVQSIGMLSVKIITPDNHMIRIPNETIIKSNLINKTHFDYRRMTVKVSVAYQSDLRKVSEVLLKAAADCEFVLKEPAPIIIFDNFADSGIDVLLGVWFYNQDFLATKNAMYIQIHEYFKKEGICIPFPQIDVHVGNL